MSFDIQGMNIQQPSSERPFQMNDVVLELRVHETEMQGISWSKVLDTRVTDRGDNRNRSLTPVSGSTTTNSPPRERKHKNNVIDLPTQAC